MRPEVQRWLQASERDEQMARQLLASGFYEGCAFHAQQAAEKALKAALMAHGHTGHTHSCAVLLETMEKNSIASGPPDLLTLARKIDMHYVESCYPNVVGEPPHAFYDKTITEEVLQWMERLKEFAKSLLP